MMLQNKKKVNIAIQVLPLVDSERIFAIVDKAIECIKASGVKHVVTPFETVMEGELHELLEIVNDIQDACYSAGSDELIINMKIHANKNEDVLIEQKMTNYQ